MRSKYLRTHLISKKFFSLFFFGFLTNLCLAQESMGFAVKSNLLNLLAKYPTLSVEKFIGNRNGIEFSYAKGELNFGRFYKYEGVLLRAKHYTADLKSNELIPFYGIYVGSLNKMIEKEGYTHPTGFFFSVASRDFTASSIRAGANVGFLFIPKKRLLLEMTSGLGYGKFFNIENQILKPAPKGYLDFQLWLSAGYKF